MSGLFSELLRRLEARLAGWDTPPQFAALFGSAARGTMTIESDIDILFIRPDTVVSDERWDAQVADLMADVSNWTGNAEPVLMDVVHEGIPLSGSRSEFARRNHTVRRDCPTEAPAARACDPTPAPSRRPSSRPARSARRSR
ncbi:nucleotidyltransferase domain-containing protein [Tomitella biformata]|uniref:nucleotidyltransferase domain-containing protein n=1 Tax=Tomitella biformata TaxID=630403 RepID=UPI000A05BA28|nr:nucleotidyltransferase domain-containing protein [Tomitella biformata]